MLVDIVYRVAKVGGDGRIGVGVNCSKGIVLMVPYRA